LPTTGDLTPPPTDASRATTAPSLPGLPLILGVLSVIALGALLLRPATPIRR